MLASVRERKKNSPYFYKYYFDVCRRKNVAPIIFNKQNSEKISLDVLGDKLKIDEWSTLLEALKNDRSLNLLAFRSKHVVKKEQVDIDTETKARCFKKHPVIFAKFILHLLFTSVAECIGRSSAIISLELEGLPIKHEYMLLLSKGIASNSSLQFISFQSSIIDAEACEELCRMMRYMMNIIRLDLSNCNLSSKCAEYIAGMLKTQSLLRFSEGWKQSLRHRDPKFESMPGLRRILLNNNPNIKNEGIKHILEVLKEDIWLKAIDLQNCGITNMGAKCILEMLRFNSALYIIDVRCNEIDDDIIYQIMIKLLYNNANKEAREYDWTVPQRQWRNLSSSDSKKFSSNIDMKHRDKAEHFYQDAKQLEKLREALEQLEIESTCRKIMEKEHGELQKKVEELENELLREQTEKEGYCLVKADAVEAVLETMETFCAFMEATKNTKKISYNQQTASLEDKNNSYNITFKELLEAQLRNIISLPNKQQKNEDCANCSNLIPGKVFCDCTSIKPSKSCEKECLGNPIEEKQQMFYNMVPNLPRQHIQEVLEHLCSLSPSVNRTGNRNRKMLNFTMTHDQAKVKQLYEQLIHHYARGE